MKKILVILGPTATGKTKLAASVSEIIGGEVISADSRQVYKGMDLGTGKDLADYQIGDRTVPYHLVDIVEPGTEYNLFRFVKDFNAARKEVESRGNIVVVCGGTGLYLEAVIEKYPLVEVPRNPGLRNDLEGKNLEELGQILGQLKKVHNITDTSTPERAIRAIEIEMFSREHPGRSIQLDDYECVVAGIDLPRKDVKRRITLRLQDRLNAGMVKEVEGLIKQGVDPEKLKFYGLEYRYITEYLEGLYNFEEMVRQLNIAIHQFSKRQMTWFRRMERRGTTIHWIDGLLPEMEKAEKALEIFTGEG